MTTHIILERSLKDQSITRIASVFYADEKEAVNRLHFWLTKPGHKNELHQLGKLVDEVYDSSDRLHYQKPVCKPALA